MSTASHVPPQHRLDAYHCPACGVYAHQDFTGAMRMVGGMGRFAGAFHELEDYEVSVCTRCATPAIWYKKQLIHPEYGGSPVAHEDMPDDVRSDYEEARQVAARSPRAAAALLRLALQKLVVVLGEPGKKLDDDIASLVAKGLDPGVQKAADIIRISGNNAVHPGELDLKDSPDTVRRLFGLLNAVVQITITQPRELTELWSTMPEGAREAVGRRDKTKGTAA